MEWSREIMDLRLAIQNERKAEKEQETKLQKAIHDYVHQAVEDMFNGKSTPPKNYNIKINI